MECHRCRGLMIVDYYIDLEDDQGLHWLRAWRCITCGEVVDPGIVQRRLVRAAQLPGYTERRTGRCKATETFQIVPEQEGAPPAGATVPKRRKTRSPQRSIDHG